MISFVSIAMRVRPVHWTSGVFILLITLLGCTSPEAPPTTAEKARDVNAVFETREVYSLRTLDSTDIRSYLVDHPDASSDSAAIMAFYARRNGQYAWFVRDTLSSAALTFLNLIGANDSSRASSSGHGKLYALVDRILDRNDTVPLAPAEMLALELDLTAQFFLAADKEYSGVVRRDLRELDWFIPRRKKDLQQLMDSLAAGRMDLSLIEPRHPQYRALKEVLRRYYRMTWLDTLPAFTLGERKKVVLDDVHPDLYVVRKKLIAFGDLEPWANDTSSMLDSAFVQGVMRFQERHGSKPDGVIGEGFVEQVNKPVADRIRTVLLNMERLRWLPERRTPELLFVNIPEFRLHVFNADTLTHSMDVVVGAQATHTVIFSDSLARIVFSPTWSVPASIVRNEILPAMRKDPNYLAKKGMTVEGGTDALPRIRQRPGASNALGLVKFLFPNSYNIYFHDTPSKGAFARDDRAASHGCIRLSEPQWLAEHLLRNDTAWTKERIVEMMHKGREKVVNLDQKIPVLIAYFTAWVDGPGTVHFRNDVYRHDVRLAQELFGSEVAAEMEAARSGAELEARR